MRIDTAYDLGQVVWGVSRLTAQRRPLCPLCDGSGRVTLANHEGRTATCPDCHGRRYDQDDTHMAAQERATITRLTLGQVRWSSTEGASYMAEETGVGSGTNWYEDRLYGTEREALDACSAAAVVFGYIDPIDPRHQVVIRGQDELEAWA